MEAFTAFIDQYPALADNAGYDFSSRVIQGELGTLQGTLTAQDGSIIYVRYQLLRQAQGWKILSVELNPELIQSETVFDE